MTWICFSSIEKPPLSRRHLLPSVWRNRERSPATFIASASLAIEEGRFGGANSLTLVSLLSLLKNEPSPFAGPLQHSSPPNLANDAPPSIYGLETPFSRFGLLSSDALQNFLDRTVLRVHNGIQFSVGSRDSYSIFQELQLASQDNLKSRRQLQLTLLESIKEHMKIWQVDTTPT
ncbi:hypothetical protein OPV22_030458 [Ensete ventricosum]|uniref:Uncharacterized protein n=1 Tax=Ensete ventricosum TaxID=4639 RepID=A0AAV8Q652_ENSVE|nr:hypothetical protein OPV22_030458 [Ensete ventricosum]